MGKQRKSGQAWVLVAAMTCLWAISSGSFAASFTGKVSDDSGTPIWGAMVTLKNEDGLGESVFTNKKGEYRLTTKREGDLQLRFRKRYHEDLLKEVTAKADQNGTVDAKLPVLTDAKALSDDHPSLSTSP